MTYGSGNSGDYKKLKGQMIQVTDTDPLAYAGSWATGANINTARKGLSGFGTSPAAIAATGNTPSTVANCESWNGSAWSEVNDVNTAKFYRGNCGTATAGLIIGGAPATGDVEEWDGTNWAETANYPGNITGPILLGIQTAAFCIGGDVPPYTTATNTYNGSAFTGSTAINTARSTAIGSGSTTAAVIAGGTSPSATDATEIWNGSAWTEVNELNTARELYGGSGDSSTGLIGFGGLATAVANTEDWNGTSWTEVGDLNTGRRELGGSTNGTSQLGLAFSGCIANGTVQSATEEWSFPSAPGVQEGQLWIKTATGTNSVMKGYQAAGTGAWATGGALPAAVRSGSGTGTQNTAFSFMVRGASSYPTATQNYNGTAWSTDPASINTGRAYAGSAGTPTAALGFGGQAPTSDANESYNGSSWSEQAEINTARHNIVGMGTQTAALGAGGEAPPITGATELWDGSSWTETADLNTNRHGGAGGGIQTAGIVAGGNLGPPGNTANAETWNGTAWTEVGNLNAAKYELAGCGVQTAAMVFGGNPALATTETWNGSSWTEVADLSTGRGDAAKNHQQTTQVEAIAVGGYTPPTYHTNTEEWTVPFATKTVGTD